MSTTISKDGTETVDMHLEVDVIPVADVERAKAFYQRLGWRFDDDVAPTDGVRIIQFTPPAQGARSRSAKESRRPPLVRRWGG
jgi:predicted enzyme related to lactoylglutathione lyase